MVWRERVRSRISVVEMDNLRDLWGIERVGRILNTQIRNCGVKKKVGERVLC